MQENISFGQCLKTILDSRELSVLEASRMLGMKSATSLSRIVHDEVHSKSLEKIYPQLVEVFSMNPLEAEALKRGLMISRMGLEQYLGYKSMWQLIFCKTDGNVSWKTVLQPAGKITIPKLESLQQLMKFLQDCSQVEITMVGCCMPEIIGALYPLANAGAHIQMRHFLQGQKKSLQHMIGNIAAIIPFLPHAWYAAYFPKGSTPPEIVALYERNEILIDSTDGVGVRRLHHLVLSEKEVMRIIEYQDEAPFQFQRQLLFMHQARLKPVKTIFGTATSPDDYIRYTEYYRAKEENQAIYSIKPDLPLNFIHPDWLVSAVLEGFSEHAVIQRGMLEELVGKLYQIHLQRWRNIFEKKKVTHIVVSAKEMMEFARTGVLTDHFFAIRPFTPDERRQILQHIRRQMTENPYFNVYFSRDENLPFQFEITAYECCVQLTEAHSNYNLAVGHSETLISRKEFLNIFINFYQSELLQAHVLSARENLAMMDRVIASISEK